MNLFPGVIACCTPPGGEEFVFATVVSIEPVPMTYGAILEEAVRVRLGDGSICRVRLPAPATWSDLSNALEALRTDQVSP